MRAQLHRETLAEQVARHLIELIADERLGPHDPLPSEAKLAKEFGVSRPIIREALKSLEARGIIEIANGKGATIRPLSGDVIRDYFQRVVRFNRQAIIELLEIRRGIEIQSAILAAQRRLPDELAEMRCTVAAMRQHLHDPDTYTQLDVKLHLLIASASRNTLLYHLVESIREPAQDTIREGLRRRHDEAQFERVQVLHEALITAIARGDAEDAARAMAQHFDDAVMAIVHDQQMASGSAASPSIPT